MFCVGTIFNFTVKISVEHINGLDNFNNLIIKKLSWYNKKKKTKPKNWKLENLKKKKNKNILDKHSSNEINRPSIISNITA